MDSFYNGYFFKEFYEEFGSCDYTNYEQWRTFFDRVADRIVQIYNPKTVLDAGCALGYLVAALRDRNVEAYGIDISSFAIDNVREDIRDYCKQQSITEDLPKDFPNRFDLVITIEVLEHLFPEDAELAIKKLCSYSDTIIFSSTPDDIEDPTHVNVQRIEYWSRLFAKNKFFRNLVVKTDFISPWCSVYETGKEVADIVSEYEIYTRINQMKDYKIPQIKLYMDFGNGYNENDTMYIDNVGNNNHILAKAMLPCGVKNLRIDLVEGFSSVVKNVEITDNNGQKFEPKSNGYAIDNYIFFQVHDPNIYIESNQDILSLVINIEIFVMDNLVFQDMFHSFSDIYKEKDLLLIKNTELQEYNRKLEEKNGELSTKNRELLLNNEELITSNRKLEEMNRTLTSQKAEYEKLVLNKLEEISTVHNNENKELEEHLIELSTQVNEVLNLKHKVVSEIHRIDSKVGHKSKDCDNMNTELSLTNIETSIEHLEQENDNLSKQLEIVQKDKEFFIMHHHAALEEAKNLRMELNKIYHSKRWKALHPIDIIRKKKRIGNDNLPYIVNIECFEYKNGSVHLGGWLYSKFDITNFAIILRSKKEKKELKSTFGLEREDVKNSFVDGNALNSGFECNANLFNAEGAYIQIEFKINAQQYIVPIGQLTVDNRIKHYLKMINKDNIDKVMYYLKRHELKHALRSHFALRVDYDIDSEYVNDLKEIYDLYYSSENFDYSASYVNAKIDIVIPIYNGYEYLEKLFQTIKNTKMKYRIIAIDDKSPDSRVAEFLSKVSEEFNDFTLLQNESNMGFVKSVNRCLALCENHVALLNTDIELPEQWLERLMYPIINNNNIASTTPYTTCGTICSFPNFCEDNLIFYGKEVNEIDDVFKHIKPQYVSMPTGIGFCMGMNIEAINKVGILDEDTFAKGYGEENDWCQRAIENGYKNVHVENLFVYHKHGGSFLSEEKIKLLQRNSKLLLEKHPNYNRDVADFCSEDPNSQLRELLIILLITKQISKTNNLYINHNIGGGATEYLVRRIKGDIANFESATVVMYDYVRNRYNIEFHFGEYDFKYFISSLDGFKIIFECFSIQKVYINNLVTYPRIEDVIDMLISNKSIYKYDLIMLMHDYYSICPTTNLLDWKGRYCRVPEDISVCENCINNNASNNYSGCKSILKWREKWSELWDYCDEIVMFSQDTKNIFEKAYKQYPSVILKPHKVNYLVDINKNRKITKTINIGLMGVLSKHKGYQIVMDMLKVIEQSSLNVKIVQIGYSLENIQSTYYIQTGKYRQEELAHLMYQYDIDIILIPSIWPETFSYTAEEAMKLGMKIASYDIGAPAERIKKYDKGLIISKIDPNTTLEELIHFVENDCQQEIEQMSRQHILFIAEYISFSSRYRVEHFMEQLLARGINSDFIETSCLQDVNVNQYTAIVIYRCRKNNKLSNFIETAHQSDIRVYYDIDDYIFNYSAIKDLDFMKDDEYKDFEEYTKNIYNCMELCDGFITSTESMKKAINMSFGEKEVCVNRNVASLEMLSISLKALDDKSSREEIVLGYFSGSKTHNADFDLISDVLIQILKQFPNVRLKTGGCLEVNERFIEVKKQIQHFNFMDWRKLPYEIASVDINLMPLESSFFHECKSENKWMEAALVQVPTIASWNKELALVIENQKNGVMCNNTEEWYDNLVRMITDKEYRDSIALEAHKYVKNHYITICSGEEAIKFISKKTV